MWQHKHKERASVSSLQTGSTLARLPNVMNWQWVIIRTHELYTMSVGNTENNKNKQNNKQTKNTHAHEMPLSLTFGEILSILIRQNVYSVGLWDSFLGHV